MTTKPTTEEPKNYSLCQECGVKILRGATLCPEHQVLKNLSEQRERNEDGELEKILESFFYAQIFDRDPDEDYVAQSVGEIKEVIKAAQSALLSRIKEEVIGGREEFSHVEGGGTREFRDRIRHEAELEWSARNLLRSKQRTTIDNIAKEIRGNHE